MREAIPGLHVSASAEVLPQFREYERCATTVLDAYLSPLLARYLRRLRDECGELGIPAPMVMQSSGGVVDAERAAGGGAWSVLSGPAGGAVGAGLLATVSGDGNALGLDMGGTSCDVCVIEDGSVRRTDSREFAGRPIQLPMLDVHTVGAGGGSIAWRDGGGALRVGPRSAGARPGPACYGNGGEEPTVTDANLLLGYLGTEGLAGGVSLDRGAAERAVASAGRRPRPRAGRGGARNRRGRERGDGQGDAGGDGRARRRSARLRAPPLRRRRPAPCRRDRLRARDRPDPLPALGRRPLGARPDRLGAPPRHGAHGDARRSGADPGPDRARRSGRSRRPWERTTTTGSTPSTSSATAGQSFELPVPGSLEPDPADLEEAFAAEHERRYGYREPGGAIELVNVRLAAHSPVAEVELPRADGAGAESGTRRASFGGEWLETAVLRGLPEAGAELAGPCVFELPETTLVLPPGWAATVDEVGTIVAVSEGR